MAYFGTKENASWEQWPEKTSMILVDSMSIGTAQDLVFRVSFIEEMGHFSTTYLSYVVSKYSN